MRKILFLLMLLSATSTFAQDVIVKKDGSTIVSKVLEITSTEVKYKKFTNLNGPTYTIAKTELKAINYENGEKETFEVSTTPITPAEQYTPQTNTPVLNGQQGASDNDLLKMAGFQNPIKSKAKKLRIAGWVIGPAVAAAGAIIVGTLWKDDYDSWYDINVPVVVCGSIMMAGGIATTTACLVRAHKLEQSSIYSVHTTPLYQQDFAFSNGTSLSTGIDMLKDNRFKSQTIGLGLRYNF